MSMNATFRLPPVMWTRNAPTLLARTNVFATLGTLVTGKHAQVKNNGIRKHNRSSYQVKLKLIYFLRALVLLAKISLLAASRTKRSKIR